MSDIYSSLGVSATKDAVKKIVKNLSKGEYPGAFCKILPDLMSGSPDHYFLMHSDGTGTKSCVAWAMYKENSDASIFSGLSQDALTMNLDDLLCVGAKGPFVFNNTIGRNAFLVNDSIIESIMVGYEVLANKLANMGVNIYSCGGETADIGDIVRTVVIDASVCARIHKDDIVDCSNVQPGHVIVGFASYGQSNYEDCYNSGIGSNGLTAIRHTILSKKYMTPDSYASELDAKAFCGKFDLSHKFDCDNDMTLGQAMLSPTRTYSPIIIPIISKFKNYISAIFHNTGGGQTKCINFGQGIHYIKDNMMDIPPIFKFIYKNSDISLSEMYQVFNMGHRMEVVCRKEVAYDIINIAKDFAIDAKIIGFVESLDGEVVNKLTIKVEGGDLVYTK